ncbi:MAG: hypothetical protein CVU08_11590 [Bacteroidetes bacterium HGW-Bacteroidetes-3]|nr:MAG: hypothetical protein CVU08_11590 [Bacteroidetes bacterium HGW-Bacteroidetes-3]
MNLQDTKPTLQKEDDDEIDLIALAKTGWEGRKTVIKMVMIFMAIGLFIAIFSPKEFTASTTMVPASDSKKIGGNLSGLASLAGINLGSMGGEGGISPTLYPQIVNSIPFQKELLQTPLTIEGQSKKVTYANYYTNIYSPGLLGVLKKYTIGLPGIIIKAIKGKTVIPSVGTERSRSEVEGINQLLTISDDENELIKQLSNQLSLDVNNKDGYVSLAATMPEAVPSAELTQRAQELLQQYIINFKIQKSSESLKFIQDRYAEKETAFKDAQQQLARFRDRNQFVNTALAQTTLERLQSEKDLAQGVYSELAKQLETQQIQVKEDTPVFTVLKPVSVPIEKSKPNRPLILIIWTFLGGIIGIGMVFGKEFLDSLKKQWNGSEELETRD